MPIGRPPPADTGIIYLPNAVAGEAIAAGNAIAVTNVGGTLTIYLCGATTYQDQFAGFAAAAASPGQQVGIIAGRGRYVNPVVEGGGPLTVDQRVFLSLTKGELTQSPPTSPPGRTIEPVGYAIATDRILLITDAKYLVPT
jgi:hypothetical protein